MLVFYGDTIRENSGAAKNANVVRVKKPTKKFRESCFDFSSFCVHLEITNSFKFPNSEPQFRALALGVGRGCVLTWLGPSSSKVSR